MYDYDFCVKTINNPGLSTFKNPTLFPISNSIILVQEPPVDVRGKEVGQGPRVDPIVADDRAQLRRQVVTGRPRHVVQLVHRARLVEDQ